MEKGFVSQINIEQRVYEVVKEDDIICYLPFEECKGVRFVVGDVIQFDEHHSDKYGKCVLNPDKISNKYFDELCNMVGKTDTIIGYVYDQKEFGYNVTYHGFNCFLPFSETYNENVKLKELNNIVNSYQHFLVKEIKNGFIILSRKDYLKDELKNLVKTEIENIEVGFTFTGRVKSVVNYGVFITNKYSEGLLHIKRIIPDYSDNMPKDKKRKLGLILEDIFKIGEEIVVTVVEKAEGKYSLIWNTEVKTNFDLDNKLKVSINELLL